MIATPTPPSRPAVADFDLAALPRAEQTLAGAFATDPMTPYVFPGESDKQRRLRPVYRVELRWAFRHGVVEMIGEGRAVAIWLPPGRTPGAVTGMIRAGALWAPFRLGLTGTWRGCLLLRAVHELHARSVSGDHWYLAVLGVHPEHQGQGWGTQLVRHGLVRAQSQNLRCYLETTNRRNIAFYERHGFRLVGERTVVPGGPGIWGMLFSAQEL